MNTPLLMGALLLGNAQFWEADCKEKCGPPSRTTEKQEIALSVDLPSAPGEGAGRALDLGPGTILTAYAAWPTGDDPVIQVRLDLPGGVTCAMSEYLSEKKLSPLVCAGRVGEKQFGVTLSELRLEVKVPTEL